MFYTKKEFVLQIPFCQQSAVNKTAFVCWLILTDKVNIESDAEKYPQFMEYDKDKIGAILTSHYFIKIYLLLTAGCRLPTAVNKK